MIASRTLLVDTSVWIKFIDDEPALLAEVLANPAVICHFFVIGELAVGDTGTRSKLLRALQTIYQLKVEKDPDVLRFLKENKIQARGIGYIDCHLLASAVSDSNTNIWTFDKRFHAAASQLGVGLPPIVSQGFFLHK